MVNNSESSKPLFRQQRERADDDPIQSTSDRLDRLKQRWNRDRVALIFDGLRYLVGAAVTVMAFFGVLVWVLEGQEREENAEIRRNEMISDAAEVLEKALAADKRNFNLTPTLSWAIQTLAENGETVVIEREYIDLVDARLTCGKYRLVGNTIHLTNAIIDNAKVEVKGLSVLMFDATLVHGELHLDQISTSEREDLRRTAAEGMKFPEDPTLMTLEEARYSRPITDNHDKAGRSVSLTAKMRSFDLFIDALALIQLEADDSRLFVQQGELGFERFVMDTRAWLFSGPSPQRDVSLLSPKEREALKGPFPAFDYIFGPVPEEPLEARPLSEKFKAACASGTCRTPGRSLGVIGQDSRCATPLVRLDRRPGFNRAGRDGPAPPGRLPLQPAAESPAKPPR